MRFMSMSLLGLLVLARLGAAPAMANEPVETPYDSEQKVVFDFYLDDPKKMGTALYWIRSFLNPLTDEPYGFAPDFMDIKVIIHGTEIVTVARKNYDEYKDVVERMRYYHALGVEFRVCGLAADDYGYSYKDFFDFVKIAPSAITELAHWQQQGYALITPQVYEKRYSIDEIR